jgi:hypothetical protein
MTAIWILAAIAFCAWLWWVRKRPLYPESLFKVTITDSEIVSTRPDGTTERCPIAELKELYIVTTSDGPWNPDVWWLFVGSSSGTGCSFPQGATGEQAALQFAQQLPGFDNATFISAMGSTSDAKFLCWRGLIQAL